MSSHHIIREKQEPALIVLGLDDFPYEQLGQLLEWSPTVITTHDTAEKLNTNGVKIDCIVGNNENNDLQSDVKLIPTGTHTLTETALRYLIQVNYPAVNIVTDELNLKDYDDFVDKISLVIFNDGRKIYPVYPGFNKWKSAGEIIEVLSPVSGLRFNGLELMGGQQYKTTQDGFFSLNFDEQFLFIAEEI